ncbi:DUF92 domain-containing protein [Paenibacillus sp. N3.4]|uniref:DUF92 domain-containing protein n=1 Tax=Paenibacillus sp. N3.4 TaxID=2603222 RepID=UPI0011C7CF0B|nr:DUF92 domain-containing protein [Paenibacillus sp. N3.4]TXK86069.1 DUF92 domain-containing protein [Paenibacillus sp. N3.4]
MVWVWGLIGSLLIAGAAYWKGSLSFSGLVAASLLGTLMFALGSLAWFGTLIAFFLTSTLLSKLKHKRKAIAESGYAKGGRRDAGQVFANGGLGLIFCIGNAIWPDSVWWWLFIGVMATVNADTWATELGGMSKSAPRSIVSGRQVAPGTSGGVTGLGLLASLLGGAFICWVGGWFNHIGEQGAHAPDLWFMIGLGAVSGLLGALIDSYLGATLQVMYRCEKCHKTIERQVHCSQKAVRIRGASFVTNDVVNAASSFAGGAICLLLSRFV